MSSFRYPAESEIAMVKLRGGVPVPFRNLQSEAQRSQWLTKAISTSFPTLGIGR